jgi:hypothetical protein
MRAEVGSLCAEAGSDYAIVRCESAEARSHAAEVETCLPISDSTSPI